MYPVSNAFLTAVKANNRKYYWTGRITTTAGTVYNFDQEDMVKGSGYITSQCCGSTEIELGTVYAAEMGISLFSEINRYTLEDAIVELFYHLQIAGGSYETIPMGIFEVSEANRKAKCLEIKAYDFMVRFEKAFTSLESIGNAYDFMVLCSTACNVSLAQSRAEIEALPNGTENLSIYSYNDNLEKEHICCAISNNKDVQVSSKKAWLADRFDEGLVFIKSVERGKCFIEYIPAENAWVPINADGYMYIDCLWVSGSFKGHGFSTDLLNTCIEDSKEKGKKGLCILASAKKKPFLADPKFLKYKGFTVCDEADNGIQLWYLPFVTDAEKPHFRECAKHPHIEEKGYVLYYTSQCPFNAKYLPVLEQTAKENDIPFHAIHIESREDAQNAPTPVTNYALFHDGDYITNEQMNDKKFLKLVNA